MKDKLKKLLESPYFLVGALLVSAIGGLVMEFIPWALLIAVVITEFIVNVNRKTKVSPNPS